MEHADIVIIGAGIIGLAVGQELALKLKTAGASGASNPTPPPKIIILEKEDLAGSGSTAACSGGIRLQFSSEANIRFSRYGLARFEQIQRETERNRDRGEVETGKKAGKDGGPRDAGTGEKVGKAGRPRDAETGEKAGIGFERNGYLFLQPQTGRKNPARSKHSEAVPANPAVALQRSLGVDVVELNNEQITELAPFLNFEGISGGFYSADEAHADPGLVTQHYLRKCREEGVIVRTNTEVTGLTVTGGRIKEITTTKGQITAGVVINCAGPFAGKVFKMAGIELPLIPRRRHVVVVRPGFQLRKNIPLIVDTATGWYLKPEPGNIALMGGTDREGTVSLEPIREEKTVDRIVEAGLERAPSLETGEIVRTIVGIRCMTPDDHAVIGRAAIPAPNQNGPEDGKQGNLYCAVGFSGHGFMHAPAASAALAELIVDGRCSSFDLRPFDPARFRKQTDSPGERKPVEPSQSPDTFVEKYVF